jgi:hypothetical protein
MRKAIVSVLAVAIVTFALVSAGEAATNNDDWALFAGSVPNGYSRVVARDADRCAGKLPGDLSAPAYTDYIDARSITSGEKRTPDVMGSWN